MVKNWKAMIKFKTEADAIEWVAKNIPFVIRPIRKVKYPLISPFTSYHSMNEVCKCLGENLFKLQNNE
jgi:hypothetical protein